MGIGWMNDPDEFQKLTAALIQARLARWISIGFWVAAVYVAAFVDLSTSVVFGAIAWLMSHAKPPDPR